MASDDKFPPPPPLPPGKGGLPTPPPLPGASKPGQPPALPPMGGGGPPLPPMSGGGLPPLPGGGASLPPMPGFGGGRPGGMPMPPGFGAPSTLSFPAMPAAPSGPPEDKAAQIKSEFEKKMQEMEKRLQDEREKALTLQLRSQEEKVTAAKVEVSLKELQDKLRRDRRDQENEESKLKLEKKAAELEQRLAQERETWVTTLKGQMTSREAQEKEIETHFAMRLQEMERRWLEEKASWQKIALAKDEEIRTLRSLSEKLKGADTELAKVAHDKKHLEERFAEVSKDRAEALARLQNANEREKEAIQLKADLQLARQQGVLIQERLERDVTALRASSREREERLLSELERVQRDLVTVKDRLSAEHDANLRRTKAEYEADLVRHKDAAEKAGGELQRLRAVCGALERQSASARVQVEELRRSAAEWEKTQERYKAEFVVLQRKWVEREKEVRAEATAQAMQMLESEKARLRVQAQDELNTRAAKIAEQLRVEAEGEARRNEVKLRADLEREMAERRLQLEKDMEAARAQLEAEAARLRRELVQRDQDWSQKTLAKDSEIHLQRGRADELAGRLARADDALAAARREQQETEKSVHGLREQLGGQQASLRELHDRVAAAESKTAELEREKLELERLASAQAAQVTGTQDALEQARVVIARETQTAKIAQTSREQAERALAAAKAESARALHELRRELETAKAVADRLRGGGGQV